LRQRRLPRADSENDPVRSRKLLRDLETRVASTNDEDSSVRDAAGVAVAGRVHLEDVGLKALGCLRNERLLEGARRNDGLVGRDRPSVALEYEPSAAANSLRTGLFSSIGSSNISA
jgi:hypothetical protein